MHSAAVERLLAAEESAPADSSAVLLPAPSSPDAVPEATARPNSRSYSVRKEVVRQARAAQKRPVESFRFDPNTVSVDDLMRLGFSAKQAAAIDNYRAKGGRYRRPSDFASSFVVADSVYERLRPYISIPKVDINQADSAAFDALPGIGPYFASKMVSYRKELGGYSYSSQLMEIWNFDQEKYNALADLIKVGPSKPYPLWSLPAEELRRHPYIRSWQTARAIVLFREHNPRSKWSVDELLKAGVIDAQAAAKLRLCRIEEPGLEVVAETEVEAHAGDVRPVEVGLERAEE